MTDVTLCFYCSVSSSWTQKYPLSLTIRSGQCEWILVSKVGQKESIALLCLDYSYNSPGFSSSIVTLRSPIPDTVAVRWRRDTCSAGDVNEKYTSVLPSY